MKKIIFTSLVLFVVFIVSQSFSPVWLNKQRDGSDPGHTGSPGDNFKNCTKCHGGSTENVNGWIRSNIPADGYVPGNRYTIKAVNTTIGHTRFGFQVSPQDLSGNLLGTLVVTDSVKTKLVGNGKYITYRTGGVIGVDSFVWEFDWIAPDVNQTTFYGAFNSNHDGHKGGDRTQLSQLTVFKQGFTNINEFEKKYAFKTFPNPAVNQLNVSLNLKGNENVAIQIFNFEGKMIKTQNLNQVLSGENLIAIDICNLKNGIYFLKFDIDNNSITKKILVSN